MRKKFELSMTALTLVAFLLTVSGCAERTYYRQYHHHTRGWYERRHTPPPPGVNFDIDVHN